MGDVPPSPLDLFRLAGRVIVVTGASSGLGERWASVVASAGGHVVLAARREAELAAVAAAVPRSLAVPTDVTSAEERRHLIDATLERFGTIDVLVNAAGTAMSTPAHDLDIAEFRTIIDTDLTAAFAVSQLAGAVMVAAGRGSIINVASLTAARCLDRYPLVAYNSAKAGLVAMTRSLAAEWGRHGVRVNAIGPAFFPSRLSGFLADSEQVAWIEQHTALGRIPRLDELDGAVLFLASDASSYVTGQHLLVDGGWSVY